LTGRSPAERFTFNVYGVTNSEVHVGGNESAGGTR
jgi:hypothetical protein